MINTILTILSSIFFIGNGSPKPSPIILSEKNFEINDSIAINFGTKCIWLAVKTEDMQAVINALNLGDVKKANWDEGVLKRKSHQTFITPPIDGWTLVLDGRIPFPNHPGEVEKTISFLNNLGVEFGEAQLYCIYSRGSGTAWIKSINGKLLRMYFQGDAGNFVEGEPTEIEEQWELYDEKEIEKQGEDYFEIALIPRESEVLEVAEAWSINPMKLEEMKNIGTFGFLGIIYN